MYAMNKTANRPGLRLITVFGLLIGLTACGGGGGSSSGGGGASLPATPVTITVQNKAAVAGAAVDAAIGGMSMSALGVQTSASEPSGVAAAVKVGKIGQTAVQRVTQSTGRGTVTGTTYSYPCTISGTYSEDVGTTSATLTFSNCSDTAGDVMNGSLTITNMASTSTTLTFDMNFNLTFTCSCGSTGSVKGDMHVVANTSTGAMTISGSSLTTTDSANGNMGLQNYSITMDASGNITAMTFTFASTVIIGTATFTMTTPFVFSGGNFPSSGAAIISGASSTKLRVTVLGNEYAPVGSQVKLELSTDNGATYGTPSYVTWADISSNI